MLPEGLEGPLSEAADAFLELEPEDVDQDEFWSACVALAKSSEYPESLSVFSPFWEYPQFLMAPLPLVPGSTTINHDFRSDSGESYYIEDWSTVEEAAKTLRRFTEEVRAALKAGTLYTKGDSA
jgi:hypothetical protein